MFKFQRIRFFPMPEYDFSEGKVKVAIAGKVLDLKFARVLARNPDLTLEQIIMLDKVQKKKRISDEDAQGLKRLRFIGGRKPNYFISANVVVSTADGELKAQYIKHRGFDDGHYREMIIAYLKRYGTATRKDINRLVLDKLPDILTEEQKVKKISNLLLSLRRSTGPLIKNTGTDKKPCWQLIQKIPE